MSENLELVVFNLIKELDLVNKYDTEPSRFNKERLLKVTGIVWGEYREKYSNSYAHGFNHIKTVITQSFKILDWYLQNIDSDKFNSLIQEIEKNYRIRNISSLFTCFVLAGVLHDVYQDSNRKNHHTKAKNLCIGIGIDADENGSERFPYSLESLIHSGMLKLVSEMCFQHRASFKGKFKNIFCEIFNTADRDIPDLFSIMKRSYLHNMDCLKRDSNYEMEIKEFETTFKITNTQEVPETKGLYQVLVTELTINSKRKYNELISNGVPKEFANVYIHVWEKYSRRGYAFSDRKMSKLYFKYYGIDISKLFNDIDAYLKDTSMFIKLINSIRDSVIYDLMGIEIGKVKK